MVGLKQDIQLKRDEEQFQREFCTMQKNKILA